MSIVSAIDLNKLPQPSIVEEFTFEAVLANIKYLLQELDDHLDVNSLLESDPMIKLLEVIAYREMYFRQRVNEAARQVMLATATGTNLDNLSILFGLTRDEGELDAELRERTLGVLEGFNTAGSGGAYRHHALTAVYEDSDIIEKVKDVFVYVNRNTPGQVNIVVLSDRLHSDSGTQGEPSHGLISSVDALLSADTVRPITDHVVILPATIVDYSIQMRVDIVNGAGVADVQNRVRQAVLAFIEAHHVLGKNINLSSLYAVVQIAGVDRAVILNPTTDMMIASDMAAYCKETDVSIEFQIIYPEDTDGVGLVPESTAHKILLSHVVINADVMSGELVILNAMDESDITHYSVYWSDDEGNKILSEALFVFEKMGSFLVENLEDVVLPDGATQLLVLSRNLYGEMTSGVMAPLFDDACAVAP